MRMYVFTQYSSQYTLHRAPHPLTRLPFPLPCTG